MSDSITGEKTNFQRYMYLGIGFTVLLFSIVGTLVARSVTRPVRRLTEAARIMEQGELDTKTLNHLLDRSIEDEVTTLARVFKQMAEKVQLREKKLKKQIVELKIEIDEQKKQEQVSQIVDSDYFKTLRANASTMRRRRERRKERRSDE